MAGVSLLTIQQKEIDHLLLILTDETEEENQPFIKKKKKKKQHYKLNKMLNSLCCLLAIKNCWIDLTEDIKTKLTRISLTHLTASPSSACSCPGSSPASACSPGRPGRCRRLTGCSGSPPSWAPAVPAPARSSLLWGEQKPISDTETPHK